MPLGPVQPCLVGQEPPTPSSRHRDLLPAGDGSYPPGSAHEFVDRVKVVLDLDQQQHRPFLDARHVVVGGGRVCLPVCVCSLVVRDAEAIPEWLAAAGPSAAEESDRVEGREGRGPLRPLLASSSCILVQAHLASSAIGRLQDRHREERTAHEAVGRAGERECVGDARSEVAGGDDESRSLRSHRKVRALVGDCHPGRVCHHRPLVGGFSRIARSRKDLAPRAREV
eukprot:767847-Hanusia_phi.AAC.3